jgi:hypothetical protein
MGFESILSNGTRNDCWYYLATSLLTSATKDILDSSLTILDIYPQVHGAIIVAFHPELHPLQVLVLRV